MASVFVFVAFGHERIHACCTRTTQLPVERKDADAMRVDERVAHAGLAVEEGNKWIATKWLHPVPFPHGPNGKQEEEGEEEEETGTQSSTKQLSRV